MTLKDISSGPDWIVWIIGILFLIISLILISGHGASLIAGYNTAGRDEKNRYDTKNLLRINNQSSLIFGVNCLRHNAMRSSLKREREQSQGSAREAGCGLCSRPQGGRNK